jgi:hypothetical protein
MKALIAAITLALAGCGVETAGTAATGASIKKQELEEGKRTQQRSQQKIEDATKLMQQSAQKRGGD